MLYLIAALTLAMQAAPAPSMAQPPSLEDRMTPQIEAAAQSVREHRPQAALDRLTPVIAAYEADHATETRRIYCGTSLQEAIVYAGMGARDKVGAVVLLPGYCTALYLKGYALVDLGRIAEAKAMYERLLTLAPMHAQYRTEYGQLIRLEKDWPRMLAICTRAQEDAGIAEPGIKSVQQGAALRCQGYALIELHRYDEAEARYRAALALDPKDAKAQNELRYIAEQRAKAKEGSPAT